MKNITNYINMAINFSILGLLIYLTIAIMDIKKALKKLEDGIPYAILEDENK